VCISQIAKCFFSVALIHVLHASFAGGGGGGGGFAKAEQNKTKSYLLLQC